MKPLIIANWKMNPSNSKEAFDLALSVQNELKGLNIEVVLCPPFVYVPQLLPSLNVFIGAQDCFWEQEGPYTGEISPAMLKNLGCSHVILGHSERRRNLKETAEMVQSKAKACLEIGLIPVVCIGQSAEKEFQDMLQAFDAQEISKIVFAYEPEWAISTQKGAKSEDPEHARTIMEGMKEALASAFGKETAEKTRIIYGGSVNQENIGKFLKVGFQGALVGAASLDNKGFVALAKKAELA
ncbi:MAG: triose-phosphate isomerase [Candidatus Wildermuthbacteria bacterium]|nr:triose-phosphate isomerase [Candidatus Wildermuthbacteria bacterium]